MIQQFPIMPYFMEAAPERFCIIQDKPLAGNHMAHGHDYLEMELILEGYGRLWLNNTLVDLQPGLLYMLSPGDYHRLEIDQAGRVISIHILPQSLSAVGFPALQAAYAQTLPQERFQTYAARLIELAQENENALPYCEQSLYAFTVQMVIDLLQNGTCYPLSQPARRLQYALQYIREHYTDPNLRLDEVAKASYLSPNYFSGVFTQTVGCHFADYVLECRLQYACILLKTATKPITEIAYEAGFSTLSHFFRCFKQALGCTPAEYRAR